MPPEGGDIDLVARVNGGDVAAFDLIVGRYYEWVRLQAYRQLYDSEEANDVAQETFLYLYRRFPGFELTSALKTLLYSTLEGLCQRRRERGKRTVEFDEETGSQSAAHEAHGDSHDAETLVAQLSAEQRNLLRLRYSDDLSVPQLSEMLSVPEGTIKSRLARATDTLRDLAGVPMRRRA